MIGTDTADEKAAAIPSARSEGDWEPAGREHLPASRLRFAGRYILRDRLGKGAMSEVWRAVDPEIGRPVAVKILYVPKGLRTSKKAEWEERFLREARAAGRLSHPGIVAIYDVGKTVDDRPFIVMELVEGRSLDAILQSDVSFQPHEAMEWIAQVAESLDAAHKRGVVHRDVKPSNVLIDAEGRARITDFGIARLSESELTREGSFLGSPAFASPEQFRSRLVDGRSDLFSLGAVLYNLIAGKKPFTGDDLAALAYEICHTEPPPPSQYAHGLPAAVESTILKALSKDPQKRFATGQDMAAAIRAAVPELRRVRLSSEPDVEGSLSVTDDPSAGSSAARETAFGRRHVTTRAVLGALSALVLAACALGGYLLVAGPKSVPREVVKPAPAPVPKTASIPKTVPVETARLFATLPQPPPEPPPPTPARVDVRVNHGPQDGRLVISSGGRQVLAERLSVSRKDTEASDKKASSRRSGTYTFALRLPPGSHKLRVQIKSVERKMDLSKEIETKAETGARYDLEVTVRSFPKSRLSLDWVPRSGAKKS